MGTRQVAVLSDLDIADCPNCYGTGKVMADEVESFHAVMERAVDTWEGELRLKGILVWLGIGLICGAALTLIVLRWLH